MDITRNHNDSTLDLLTGAVMDEEQNHERIDLWMKREQLVEWMRKREMLDLVLKLIKCDSLIICGSVLCFHRIL